MASAVAACPLGILPPVFKHSSIDAKAVNFLVLVNDALVLSWQMPDSDFLMTGSAEAADFGSAAKLRLRLRPRKRPIEILKILEFTLLSIFD